MLLQTRHGKRTGAAAVRIAVELVGEGVVTEDEAVANLVEPTHVDQLLHLSPMRPCSKRGLLLGWQYRLSNGTEYT